MFRERQGVYGARRRLQARACPASHAAGSSHTGRRRAGAFCGGGNGGSGSVRIGFLLGDLSQNRVVTVSDLAPVNAQIAQPVTGANYLKDVNASGTLTVADKGIANTQLTKALPAP